MAVDPPLQSAGSVVSVDPNVMVMTPAPMPRNPAPVSSTTPIARPVDVVGLITDADADTNRIRCTCESAHAKQSSEKQSKFLHSCLLRIDLDDFEPPLFNPLHKAKYQTRTGSVAGSIHFPCSRIKSFSRSTASASGMLNFTAVLPT